MIVDTEGIVRLVDFGTLPPERGVIRGAPAYLSPEIWRGATTSFEADLFALGSMLHDLATAFAQVPSAAHARDRSERLSRSGDPLLDPDPSKRRLSKAKSDDAHRARLAKRVAERLAEKRERIETQALSCVIPVKRKPWIATVAASALAIVSTLSISVRAEAPLEMETRPTGLEIRSNRWLEIEINGKTAGFTPVAISHLREGFHRVRWRGEKGSGEARIELLAGRTRRLGEKDLNELNR